MHITPTRLPTYGHAALGHTFHHIPLKKVASVAFLCLLAVGALFAARSLFSRRPTNQEPPLVEPSPDHQSTNQEPPLVEPSPDHQSTKPNNMLQRRFSNTTVTQCDSAILWTRLALGERETNRLMAPFEAAHQPRNIQITQLKNLYPQYMASLAGQIKTASSNPWIKNKSLDATALECMNAMYTISRLTLDEVELFGQEKTCFDALTSQDLYLCQTFYLMGALYHMIRGAPIWDKATQKCVCPDLIPANYTMLFYEKNTLQNGFRMLYNDCCERINKNLKPKEAAGLGIPIEWTQEDKNPENFIPCILEFWDFQRPSLPSE